MNGTKYLLDTCLILGLYQQTPEAMSLLINNQVHLKDCAISVINRMEIFGFSGLNQTDEYALQQLIGQFQVLPLSRQIEMETIRLRKSHKIKLPDAIIWATATSHDLTLLTLDKRLSSAVLHDI